MATWESTRACSGNLFQVSLFCFSQDSFQQDEMACIHDVVPPEFKQVPLIFLYRSFKSFLVFGCIVAQFKHQVK